MPPRPRRNAGSPYPAQHRAEDMRAGLLLPITPPGTGEGDPRGRSARGRRPGPRHYGAGEPRRPRAARLDDTLELPRPVSGRPARRPRFGGIATDRARRREVVEAGQTVSYLSALRGSAGAKPSVTGRAAGGAVAGGTAGLAIGGPVGAGVGATLGGVGGGISGARAKKAYKAAMRQHPIAKKILVAEFTVCMVIIALSPLTDRHKDEPAGKWMRRMTAVMFLFILLGLVSAGGAGAAKLSAAFGGLVTVVLAVSERDLAIRLAGGFAQRGGTQNMGPGPGEEPDPAVAPGQTGGPHP